MVGLVAPSLAPEIKYIYKIEFTKDVIKGKEGENFDIFMVNNI